MFSFLIVTEVALAAARKSARPESAGRWQRDKDLFVKSSSVAELLIRGRTRAAMNQPALALSYQEFRRAFSKTESNTIVIKDQQQDEQGGPAHNADHHPKAPKGIERLLVASC
jgi:hypothetical protein